MSVSLPRLMDISPTNRVEYHSDNRTHAGLPWLMVVSVFWPRLLAFHQITPTKPSFGHFREGSPITRSPCYYESTSLIHSWDASGVWDVSGIYGERPAIGAVNVRLPLYLRNTAVDCLIWDASYQFRLKNS